MKLVFVMLLLGGLFGGGYIVATDRNAARSAARLTARGLRATWEWLDSLDAGREPAQRALPARRVSRKAQARTASREGIVPQQPKEKLQPSDRAALDTLLPHEK